MTKDGFRGQQSSRGSQRNRDFMKHYYDCTSRLFSDGRAGDHLNELFLNAAKNGDFERVQNFLARTSRNMTVNVDAKDKETGLTAIMLAAMNQHPKVVSLLLNYGADITLCNSNGQSILDLVSDSMRPLLLGSVARQGFSARHLLQAAWQGNSQLVKKLLSSRFQLDVNCTNADGFTPLLLVTRDLNLFEKIEKAVMENGYNPVEVVKELLQNNADMEAKDSEGKRPLHFAAFGKGSHAKDVIDVLIQNSGSDIDVPDGLSDSPLHWASKEDNQPIILALIKGGADVNVRGHIGRTPLHVAASYGHERSSGTLLDHGADVTITDDNGLSPVDVAKGRRVQLVLTEAWAEQTKDSTVQSKRIFSAPPNHVVETESVQSNPESESQDAVRSNTAPSQGLTRRLKKRSQSSLDDIYTIDERTKLPPSKKLSDVRMPRIPSAEKLKSTPGSLRSSLASVTKEQSGKQEFALGQKEKQPAVALPSLAVLNIELSYVSNLRGGSHLRAKMVSAQQPSPPRHRLSKRLSSPVLSFPRRLYTPGSDRDERLRSSSTSQVPDLSSVSRMAVPARVAPLGIRRVLTPELRSTASPDPLAQDNLSLVQDVVDLDLLRKGGHESTSASSMLFPEFGEVTPPPPSPIPVSESPFRSEETGDLGSGPLETETAEGLDTTRTFTSIPRPTFWIPLGGGEDINKEKMSTPVTEDETSANGTKFYIDLKHLEALSSGQCSACGKSLPEGHHPQEFSQTGEHPRTSQSPSAVTPDKELCKSCQPRRGSNEEVFWIPFSEKEKSRGLKSKSSVESEGDHRKMQDSAINVRRKSKDDSTDKSKSQTANITEKTDRTHSGKRDSKSSSVVSSASNESTISSRDQLRSEISPRGSLVSSSLDLTGFDVSCLCNNTSGVCSCTIVRKDLPFAYPAPSEPASEFDPTTFLTESVSPSGGKEVVKTRGESSTPTESTSVERRMDDFVSSSSDVGGSTSMVDTKSQTKKPSAATSTSLSEDNVLKTTASIQGAPKSTFNSSAYILKEGSSEAPQMVQGNQEVPSEVDQEGLGVSEKHEPSPPKQAWTTPRGEEPGTSSVTIVNAFPSPLPPEDRSAVHPPIGPAGDGRPTSKKGAAGKTKGKKAAGKSCCNGSKSAKSKNKAKSQGSSGTGKKKWKGKKKSDVKMITVQQREVSEELGLRTISDGGGFDMPEDVPGPPTISLDSHSTFSRPFNTLMNKYMILSPIPESPRSVVSTPRTGGTTENTQEDGVQLQEQNTNVESRAQTEAGTELNDSTKEGNDGELDVVDGGMISRMFGMCIPRLNLGNSDSDSDTESNEPLVNQCDLASEQESVNDAAMPLGTGDDSSPEGGVESQDVVQDEADDEMEEIIQSQLETKERTNDSVLQSNTGSNSWSHAVTQDSLTDVTICHDSGPSERRDESNGSVISFKYSASGKADSELITPDEELDPSRATSAMTSFSDTDSSYNSCDSASPRPLSSASSLNSSDTYFSSPRDSSCAVTPTPDRETYSENSVEIEYFDRMKSSVSTGSGSTVRAQSNTSLTSAGASSQGSADSFATENLVRSRLSATSRSISSSSSSCQDEIVWKKGNIVGRGAFGTVCCGLTNTGEIIAVKQVELNHSNADEAEKQYEKLQEEVSLLKSLTHENIVRFIGTCFDGGVVNIFMEYVPGGSIASILARFGCLDESVFCRYTKQLLSGVSYLHGNNVIHRDIKGGNILIMPSGVLKLIDFGCAKRLCLNLSMSKSNILRSMKGTPYWMAPEVIRETGHGRKSDIWSVGCTVYEMATRKPPWSDMPPMAAIFAIGSGSLAVPELSETVTKEAQDFVNKCLTRDPDVRPSADELLQHPFIKHPS